MLKSLFTRNRRNSPVLSQSQSDGPARCVVAEPLEERLMMALSKAGGGSGYSGTLSTSSDALRQYQLICDPAEPRTGSTSVQYDPSKVSLAGYQYGPGYGPMPLPIEGVVFGYVEVQVTPTARRLEDINSFLAQPSGPETGYVQIFYGLNGQAGQLQPPKGFTIRDEGGVDGVDTHALLFRLDKSIPPGTDPVAVDARFTIFAAPAGSHSNNFADFMEVNDGSGTKIGPADILPTTVSTRPTDGSLAGFAFEDSNADGVFGAAESGIPGVTVYLDANQNGTRDATEPARVTDEEGHYLFENLSPGRYFVRETTPAGYLTGLTVPTSGVRTVTVVPGIRQRNVNFGNIRNGTITGLVWKDLSGDGLRQRTEPAMGGVTVYADFNDNGQLDLREPTAVSSPVNGTWSIGGLRPGTYVVREVVPADYVQTAPAARFFSVNVPSGQTAGGNSFGNRMPAPRVTGVYLSGSGWSPAYLNFLQAAGLGDAAAGYRIDPAGGRDLPMIDPDRISIRFDRPVSADAADLAVTRFGGLTTYPVGGYSYNAATRTGTWTLTQPVQAERLVMTLSAAAGGVTNTDGTPLDGEWPAAGPAYPTGNGTPGGNFQLGFAVLGGDSTGDGVVNALDLADVKRRLGRTTVSPGAGTGAYTLFADVNPDTRINALDLAAVKQRLGRRLPRIIIFPPIDPIPIDPLPIDPLPIIPVIPSPPNPLPIPYPNVSIGSATHDLFSDSKPIV